MLQLDSTFAVLAKHSELLEPVLELASKGLLQAPTSLGSLAGRAGISLAKLPELARALRAGAGAAVFNEASMGQWHLSCSPAVAADLALMLRGLNVYRQRVHEDRDRVTAVISKPAEPSQFTGTLEKTLEGFRGLETTAEALIDLAHRAQRRFTVMSPFVDSSGLDRLLALFGETGPAVRRELITRRPFDVAVAPRLPELQALGVQVYDFRIAQEKVGRNETFHAKVVRVDEDECYVGSSNMNEWSFHYSLELGFNVKGRAANRISQVLDAVIEVSAVVHLVT